MRITEWAENYAFIEKALSGRELMQRRQAARSRRKGDKAEFKSWKQGHKQVKRKNIDAFHAWDERQVEHIARRQGEAGIGIFRGSQRDNLKAIRQGVEDSKATPEYRRFQRSEREVQRSKESRSEGANRHAQRRKNQRRAGLAVAGAAAIGAAAYAGNKNRNKARIVATGAGPGHTDRVNPIKPVRRKVKL